MTRKSIKVYVEGDAKGSGELRLGFNELFKSQREQLEAKDCRLDFVFCGPRSKTHKPFLVEYRNAAQTNSQQTNIVALLVDSESPIVDSANPEKRKQHLANQDQWDLKGVSGECIHLMVQCMETWIVADQQAVAHFYGQAFLSSKLPTRMDLENEPKTDVLAKLSAATKPTQKSEYHKLKHARLLLEKLDPEKIAQRCPAFKALITWLESFERQG